MRKRLTTSKFAISVPFLKRAEIRDLLYATEFNVNESKGLTHSIFTVLGNGPAYVELKRSLRDYWIHRERKI